MSSANTGMFVAELELQLRNLGEKMKNPMISEVLCQEDSELMLDLLRMTYQKVIEFKTKSNLPR